jgi:hypothetical protein
MNGTITFDSVKELAEFLVHFTGSTAIFSVVPSGNQWILTFRGGF